MQMYAAHIHSAKEWHIDDLTLEDLKQVCQHDKESAAGLDGWAARDIALISDLGLQLMVDFFNEIERGAPWPAHMLEARAVFLSKDPNKTMDPLAYRILKITSGWYRKWGTVRNRQLQGWVHTWDNNAFNSGVPGKGAHDAWMQTALMNEINRLSGLDTAGGSVDIYKCFDQVDRELIYLLAEEAGMPKRILDPYFRYIDNLNIRYQTAKVIGQPHRDVCSIPQGCRYSMTMVALLMIPWVSIMEKAEVIPRVLADDLMFTSHGDGHQSRTIRAMELSLQYFEDIGAKVANNKCFLFATNKSTRKALAKHVWSDGHTIPISNTFRDLGAHMNLTQSKNGSTLTERMRKATKMAKRLRWLPISIEHKRRIVLSNIIPAAIYGVEVTEVNQAVLQELTGRGVVFIRTIAHLRAEYM